MDEKGDMKQQVIDDCFANGFMGLEVPEVVFPMVDYIQPI